MRAITFYSNRIPVYRMTSDSAHRLELIVLNEIEDRNLFKYLVKSFYASSMKIILSNEFILRIWDFILRIWI